VEVTNWQPYKQLITQYGGIVILELVERNARDGITDVSNTLTIRGAVKS
jgi:hypothetical protein